MTYRHLGRRARLMKGRMVAVTPKRTDTYQVTPEEDPILEVWRAPQTHLRGLLRRTLHRLM